MVKGDELWLRCHACRHVGVIRPGRAGKARGVRPASYGSSAPATVSQMRCTGKGAGGDGTAGITVIAAWPISDASSSARNAAASGSGSASSAELPPSRVLHRNDDGSAQVRRSRETLRGRQIYARNRVPATLRDRTLATAVQAVPRGS